MEHFGITELSLRLFFSIRPKLKRCRANCFPCSAVAGPPRIFRLQIYKTIRRIATEVPIFLGVGDKDKPPLKRGGYRESNPFIALRTAIGRFVKRSDRLSLLPD